MPEYLIGIDIGTQGTKAVLFDLQLSEVASAFEQSKLISPRPGTTWQEADDIWGSVLRVLRELTEKAQVKAGEVLALGLDSQMAGIMGIGADGEAATVYDSWLDIRCGSVMPRMRALAGRRAVEITGGPVTYTHGPKILWLKENYPELYNQTAKFVLPHAYVVGKLCGHSADEAYFDYTCLHFSGFGDNLHKCWSDELLDLYGIDKAKMARIVSPFELCGTLSARWADATGLPAGTPIVCGAGDTACSVFGSGLFENGALLDCAGTASALCCAADSYAPDTQYETMTMMRSPEDGQWFPLAYINGGGLGLRWFRDEFTGTPPMTYGELEALAEDLPPGSEGLLFVPHFAGRVLPNNPHVRGSFTGLDWKHGKQHLFKATMEGIAYEYHYYLSVMRQLYPQIPFTRVTSVGGGAVSRMFMQIKADVLGLPVRSCQTGETAALGSAVIAGAGAGVLRDYKPLIERAMTQKQLVEPDMNRHALYAPYAKTYLELIRALEPVFQSEIFESSELI